MKEYKMLLSVLLKSRRNGKTQWRKSDGKPKIGFIFFLSVSIVIGVVVLLLMGLGLGEAAFINGTGVEILALLIAAVQGITFLYGTAAVFSVMFLSDDNEFLLSLPVSPRSVYLVKLTIVYLSELALSAFILIPIMTTFGATYGGTDAPASFFAAYYLMMPLIVLTAPMFPLLIISIFSAPLMYCVAFFKKRAALSGIASIVGIVAVFAAYYWFLSNASGLIAAQETDGLMSGSTQNTLKIMSYVIYPLRAAAEAALAVNVGRGLGIFTAFIAVVSVLAVLVMTKMYRRGMAASLESGSSIKKYGVLTERDVKKRSQITALISRDFKNILRSPALAVNSFLCVFMPAIMLLFFKMSLINGIASASAESGGTTVSVIVNTELVGTGILFFVCFLMCFPLNYTASIAFTREGKTFYMLRYLPLEAKDILKSKRLFADIVSYVSIVLVVITALIAGLVTVTAPLVAIALVFFARAFNSILIRRDIKRPRLEWNNVNEALKGNMYLVAPMYLSMFAGMAVLITAIVCAVVAGTLDGLGLNGGLIAGAIFWVLTIAAAVVAFIFLDLRSAPKTISLFDQIEENAVSVIPLKKFARKNKGGFLG
ncbi:MAG: hypothetical protein LBT55_06655 [Clostridiaceae bacterium]|nr:hypothetical protein [Clostridiaceae bacterium]